LRLVHVRRGSRGRVGNRVKKEAKGKHPARVEKRLAYTSLIKAYVN